CSASVMCWSRKNSTRWSSSALRMRSTVASSSSSRRSTPCTSAPIVAVTGVMSIVMPRRPSLALGLRARYCLVPKILTQGRHAMTGGPRFAHLDDMKWQEVRRMRQGDREMSVREKWLDFSPRFLSLYAKWDPGMIVQPHGHNSNHVVFVLDGEMTCGDVVCRK